VLSPQLTGVEDNASLPFASSLCGACYEACPVAIDIPAILVHLRAEHVEAQRRTTAEALAFRALARAMSNPRLWRLAQTAATLGRLLARGRPTLPAALPPPAWKWTRSRDLPTPPAETFTSAWAREHRGRRR
jgi:L-lactate dehydrogenase complex protein LldF